MSAQPLNGVSLYSDYGTGSQNIDPSCNFVNTPADSKIVEYVLPLFSWEPDETSSEDRSTQKALHEDKDSDPYQALREKVVSTVDSDIHPKRPKYDDELNEMKDILCADPKTVATPYDRPSKNQGKYQLQFNYPRLREFLLDEDKFENVMLLLADASEAEREKMEAVFFRFAVSFDEKEVLKATEELVLCSIVEEEVQIIQHRLKKSIRRIKRRDKKFLVFQCLMPQTRKSSFLESFFHKN